MSGVLFTESIRPPIGSPFLIFAFSCRDAGCRECLYKRKEKAYNDKKGMVARPPYQKDLHDDGYGKRRMKETCGRLQAVDLVTKGDGET